MKSKSRPDDIIYDLKFLFEHQEIQNRDFEAFIDKLKCDDVKDYLIGLSEGAAKESQLRESFFNINSRFSKYLFQKVYPEIHEEEGFIDYLITTSHGEKINLELKALYDGIITFDEDIKIFEKIKKVKLNPDEHKNQIIRYLKTGRDYVILSNLEDWYFYSKDFSLDIEDEEKCEYFAHVKLLTLLKDFDEVEDIWFYLNFKEDLVDKKPLDDNFYISLKNWVERLKRIIFKVDEQEKIELIINLINKFIFIQSLDKFWVIEKNYLLEEWNTKERRWKAKNKIRVLKKFLNEINDYLYELYDTELFQEAEDNITILDYIEDDINNVENFYENLKFILGIDFGKTTRGYSPGIIQYNFRRIDEDILGKAYETFLGEIRKEQGIYYTPRYITKYMVKQTVGKLFDNLLQDIRDSLMEENFPLAQNLMLKFFSIKIVDTACGSGSFLIKTLKIIWKKYKDLNNLLENKYNEYAEYNKGNLAISKVRDAQLLELTNLINLIGFAQKRELISKIILRHLYGNDLDIKALEIAKLNIWLEAIKLSPRAFQYSKVPPDTNRILPDLKLNFSNGDTIVGFSSNTLLDILKTNFENDIKELNKLRKNLIQKPQERALIKEITNIKTKIKTILDSEFKSYINEKKLPNFIITETKPFYWELFFWYIFFDDDAEFISEFERGFDIVIGNPPYERASQIKKWKKYYKIQFKTIFGACDIYVLFMEKAFNLLKQGGYFSYITSNKYIIADYGQKIRKKLLSHTIYELVDFTECPSVFNDAFISPLITTIQKQEPPDDHQVKIIIFKSDVPQKILKIGVTSSQDEFSVEFRAQSDLENKYTGHFSIYITPDLKIILDKLYEDAEYYEDVCEYLRTGIMGFEYNNMKPIIYDSEIAENDEDLILLTPSLISQFSILWGEKQIKLFKDNFVYLRMRKDLSLVNESTWKFFQSKKVIFRGTARKLEAAYDDVGRALLVAIHGAISDRVSYSYQLALLNSYLFNWIHVITYLSARIPQGSLRYPVEFYNRLPIKINEKYEPIFKDKVEKYRLYNNIQRKISKLWEEICTEHVNDKWKLGKILLMDKNNLNDALFDEVITSSCSIYPDSNTTLLNKYFEKLIVRGEEINILKIFGIFNNQETELLILRTNNDNFRELLYLDIKSTLAGRLKITSLMDLFNKVDISVIKPNIWEKSGNLVKILLKFLNEWLVDQRISIKVSSILEIEELFNNIDYELNAHVFKLYNLKEEEISLVLKTLNISHIDKINILKKYRKI